MTSYLCHPKRHNTPEKVICVSLLVTAILSFYFSNLFSSLRALGQGLSAVLLFFFIFFTIKYLLTDYRYAWENGNLILSSRLGRKEKSLGSIPITKDCRLVKKEQWNKGEAKPKSRFSYCQNLFPPNAFYLVVSDKESYLLCFEPDETLLALLRSAIEASNSKNE